VVLTAYRLREQRYRFERLAQVVVGRGEEAHARGDGHCGHVTSKFGVPRAPQSLRHFLSAAIKSHIQ
jgi:hypothetical protein